MRVKKGKGELKNSNEDKIKNCHCGGEVQLIPSKPWAQDPSMVCNKCNGCWSYGTYSDKLTIEEWNKRH